MLIVFQNTIIYNPFMPPDARSLRIADFAKQCSGIEWREERIKSLDGTEIALCVADVRAPNASLQPKMLYLLYFQGNASSLPPRLPDISRVIKRVQAADDNVQCTIVAVSYRGYWTSHDRPYERGIDKDTEAAFRWTTDLHRRRQTSSEGASRPTVVFWGQSVGCGFATNLAAQTDVGANLHIDGLVLETPFTNTRDMLKALYPQKWLPYQYLWPFLRNHLDSMRNLSTLTSKEQHNTLPQVHIIEGGKDELVPLSHGKQLFQHSSSLGLSVYQQTIRNALHNQVLTRPDGKQAIANAILAILQHQTQ